MNVARKCVCGLAGLFLAVMPLVAGAGNRLTEEAYLYADSVLWGCYEASYARMQGEWKALPEKSDSLQAAFERMYDSTCVANVRLAVRYACVPSGLQRCFMVRNEISKASIDSILHSLGPEIEGSYYGKLLRQHVQAQQVEEGMPLVEFPCFTSDGQPFDWSRLDGRQVLLLYGGLGCMGESGRRYLQQLYARTSRSEFLIVVYWPCSSPDILREVEEEYASAGYIFISDFKMDASPIRILYGAQATPTCFLADERHVVRVKCVGLSPERFDKQVQ